MPSAVTAPPDSFQPTDRADWRGWLAKNHTRTEAIWLIYGKKGAGSENLTTTEAVEEALCYGWIDSLPRKLDATRSMLRFSPRKPGTGWSRVNKERIARLAKAGLMAAPGKAKIAAAKKDGSWTKLDNIETLAEPPDLKSALNVSPQARQNWDTFPRSAKRAILEWITQAKKPETREARIQETVTKAAQNLRANQWRQPKG